MNKDLEKKSEDILKLINKVVSDKSVSRADLDEFLDTLASEIEIIEEALEGDKKADDDDGDEEEFDEDDD